MRRLVFGPRRPISLPAPPPNLTQQQPAGRVVVASPEPPHPDQLAGRVVRTPWGLAQPVFAPTPITFARTEEPRPEAGRVSVARPPYNNTPKGRITTARGADAPPWEGRVAEGTSGFPDSRRPVRPLVAKPECARSHLPGTVLVAKSPPPNLTPQQITFVARVARIEEPPPFAGWCWLRQKPLVPSERLRFVPLVARIEEPPPFAGASSLLRVKLGNPPPNRAYLFSVEPPRPAEGRAAKLGPAVVALVPQQMPGRIAVARVEPPRVWDGWLAILTGRLAGAIPPTIPDDTTPGVTYPTRSGGVFRRADTSRWFRRIPRMSAASLAYLTRTKTPTEIVVFVFDFSTFPEVIAGATITSAVVSGPGGSALSGLVAGTPAVLTAAAIVDADSNTVAAGKGVRCTLSGGSAGSDVLVECAATLSTGSVAVVQGKVAVRNAV